MDLRTDVDEIYMYSSQLSQLTTQLLLVVKILTSNGYLLRLCELTET